MDIEYTCPLGHKCEQIVDGKLQRCAWYVKMYGSDPQTGQHIEDSKCSMAWQPLLMVETNGNLMRTNASVQSMRNETIKRQDLALGVINNARVSSDT